MKKGNVLLSPAAPKRVCRVSALRMKSGALCTIRVVPRVKPRPEVIAGQAFFNAERRVMGEFYKRIKQDAAEGISQ